MWNDRPLVELSSVQELFSYREVVIHDNIGY